MNSSFYFSNFLQAYRSAKAAFPDLHYHDGPSSLGQDTRTRPDSPLEQSTREPTSTFSSLVGAYSDSLPLNTEAA